ncbi:MAG: ImmA/IrrE family metallo-endopeptidase [Ruminiclostridium sp.]|nr:ImmA/IrrE family metallo-endopeptidase [Ruminiclostridium sp.]
MLKEGEYMVKVPVNPYVLKWARESLNLTIDEVTSRLNKRADVIEAWETGADAPSYAQLEKLAYDVYKRPIAVFFFPHPPKEDDAKKSFRTIPVSEFERLPSSLVRKIRNAVIKKENLYELCSGINPAAKQLLKEIKGHSYNIHELASVLRGYLGISLDKQKNWDSVEEALENWRKAFEDTGIFIFKEAFRNDDFSGFCLYDREFPQIIINNSMVKTRQIFTLFHELGHLLYETSGIDGLDDDFINMLPKQDSEIELLCNRIASEILVPSQDFDMKIRGMKANEESITNLALLYKVSREVILRKFADRMMIDQSTYKELSLKWIEESRRHRQDKKGGGDYYNTQIAYLGDKYIELAFNSYYKKLINDIQLTDYLNIRLDNLPSLELSLHKRWVR